MLSSLWKFSSELSHMTISSFGFPSLLICFTHLAFISYYLGWEFPETISQILIENRIWTGQNNLHLQVWFCHPSVFNLSFKSKVQQLYQPCNWSENCDSLINMHKNKDDLIAWLKVVPILVNSFPVGFITPLFFTVLFVLHDILLLELWNESCDCKKRPEKCGLDQVGLDHLSFVINAGKSLVHHF